jgi:hypothetical protein
MSLSEWKTAYEEHNLGGYVFRLFEDVFFTQKNDKF